MSHEIRDYISLLWNDIYGQGDLGAIDEHFTSDFVWLAPPGVPPDAQGFKDSTKRYRAAFSDIKFDFVEQVIEGNKVASRVVITGRHTGDFAGLAATGKKVEFGGAVFMELRNGKIAAERGVADMLTLMQQIGAIPS